MSKTKIQLINENKQLKIKIKKYEKTMGDFLEWFTKMAQEQGWVIK